MDDDVSYTHTGVDNIIIIEHISICVFIGAKICIA